MYQPFNIGNRLRIVPPDCAVPQEERIDLVIAKGAFGSGEHETTASCIEVLEELPGLDGARLLDLGSGTGILALATLKLGADKAVCVDINPDAVKTCERNCKLNGYAERVRHVTGSLETVRDRDFDLVLANIYGDLLVDFAAGLVERTREGGMLLLSGILWEYNFEVRTIYEKLGCTLVKNQMLGEFSTALMKKNAG